MYISLLCSNEIYHDLEKYLENYQMKENTEFLDKDDILIAEINCLDKIREIQNCRCKKVVIIENGDLIFEILELNPELILRKPYIENDKEILHQYLKKQLPEAITLKVGSNQLRLIVRDIIYIESYMHVCIIHTIEGEFKVRQSLSSLKEILNPYGFIQIHKSYMVNQTQIIKISNKECCLKNNEVLVVGRKYSHIGTIG